MFKFGNDIPFHRLENKTISWICLSSSRLKISIDDNNQIVIFHRLQFCERNNISERDLLNQLLQCCDHEVTRINMNNVSIVTVQISNGFIFNMVDLADDFENYAFMIDGIEYIV